MIKIFKLSAELHWYFWDSADDREYADWLVKEYPGQFRFEDVEE